MGTAAVFYSSVKEMYRLQDAATYGTIRKAILDKILDVGLQFKSNKVGLVLYGTVCEAK